LARWRVTHSLAQNGPVARQDLPLSVDLAQGLFGAVGFVGDDECRGWRFGPPGDASFYGSADRRDDCFAVPRVR
jgi:hypothetical protein